MIQETRKRIIGLQEKKKKNTLKAEKIKERIMHLFKHHIGLENAISPYEIFEVVFRENPDKIDPFERAYLWNIIARCLVCLRSNNECFIVRKGLFRYYVLKSQEELARFEELTDKHIKGLQNQKKNARKWIKNKSWEKL